MGGGGGPNREVPSGGGPRSVTAGGVRPQAVGAGGAMTWSTRDRGERRLTGGSHCTVATRSQTCLNPIQNLNSSNSFKFFQTLADPKGTFLRSKNLKQNMGLKDLNRGTTFSIGTSSDSKLILN
jgi:hypothetical protein